MTDSNETVIRRLIEEGWNSHDPARLREHYDSSVSFRSPLVGEVCSLEAVEQFVLGLFKQLGLAPED